MKKFIYTFVAFAIVTVFSFSSAQKDRAEDAIKNATYIFDGQTCGMKFIKNDDGTYYVTYRLVVNNLMKGDKKLHEGDTIELVSEMPEEWHLFGDTLISTAQVSDLAYSMYKGASLGPKKVRGVYFLKPDVFKERHVYRYYSNYFSGYFGIRDVSRTDSLNISVITKEVGGFGKKFRSIAIFNEYLVSMGLKPILYNDSDYTHKKKDVFSEETEKTHLNKSEQGKLNYDKHFDIIAKRKANNSFTAKTGKNIFLEVKNESMTCDTLGATYYEFDVFISCEISDTYLDNVILVLQYNQSAFNKKITDNNKIVITKGNAFNNATYEDPMSGLSDETENSIRFRLGFSKSVTSWNRTLLTPTPQQLVHLKIKINRCENFSSDILFIDDDGAKVADTYTENATISPSNTLYFGYTPNYTQPNPFYLCAPLQIIDFYPKSISSGINSILTIVGKGFGCYRGTTQVLFKNADDGGANDVLYLNHYDYIDSLWSDTLIQIKLPYSVQDTLSLTTNYPLGSGIFQIKKGTETATSSVPLTIRYAVMNHNATNSANFSEVYRKVPYRHVSSATKENNRAIEFYLDTSIANKPDMKAVVYKALKDWSCATGINWAIIDTIHQSGFNADGKSIIFLTDVLPDPTAIASANSRDNKFCSDELTGERFIYFKETDIGFLRVPLGKTWFIDTNTTQGVTANKYDFYSTALHELGHVVNLGHVINTKDVMHYGETYGPIPASDRLNLDTYQGAIEGGQYIVDKSVALDLLECDNTINTTKYTPENCGNLSVTNSENQDFVLNCYPNPFNSSITIEYNVIQPSELSFQITDITGRIISIETAQNSTIGINKQVIDLKYLRNGVYLLNIIDGNNTPNGIRIIKQD